MNTPPDEALQYALDAAYVLNHPVTVTPAQRLVESGIEVDEDATTRLDPHDTGSFIVLGNGRSAVFRNPDGCWEPRLCAAHA